MPKGLGKGSKITQFSKGCIPANKGKGMKYEIRICTVCGDEFTNPQRTVKTCSKECRYKSCSLKKGRINKGTTIPRKEKKKAQRVIQRLIKQGVLKRLPCKICGNIKTIGHHYLGYEKIHWLDVEWLCEKCHKEEHKRLRKML